MKTGLKVWLWFVFVVQILSCISVVIAIAVNPIFIVSLIASALIIIGCALLLFKTMKLGYFMMCGGAVVNLIVNLIFKTNIIIALLGLILMPLITYLLMKDDWNNFK